MAKINTAKALETKPRPHYLIGEAYYSLENGIYRLNAKALFPTSRDSIFDRARTPIPHANIGDAYFGLWNGIHIITEIAGVYGTLTSQGQFIAKRPLPPDTELDFQLTLANVSSTERHISADYLGIYLLKDKELIRIFGTGIGRKKAQ